MISFALWAVWSRFIAFMDFMIFWAFSVRYFVSTLYCVMFIILAFEALYDSVLWGIFLCCISVVVDVYIHFYASIPRFHVVCVKIMMDWCRVFSVVLFCVLVNWFLLFWVAYHSWLASDKLLLLPDILLDQARLWILYLHLCHIWYCFLLILCMLEIIWLFWAFWLLLWCHLL